MAEILLPQLEEIARSLLAALHQDTDDPNLRDTPRRWAAWWREFLEYDPGTMDTGFQAITTDQLVAVRKIEVWSLCAHHLLPFSCEISIGYLTGDKVLGLSKFARIAQEAAHRLQLQERLVDDIATRVSGLTGSDSVAVVGKGLHLCMAMRGIKAPAEMVTSVMRGRFRESEALRLEFLATIDH